MNAITLAGWLGLLPILTTVYSLEIHLSLCRAFDLCSNSTNGIHVITGGVTNENGDAACASFGLLFEGIESSMLPEVSDILDACNVTNALLKALDGLFADQCLYVNDGIAILPGNLTFCYDNTAPAICLEPLSSVTMTTAVSSTTTTATSIVSFAESATETVTLPVGSDVTTFSTIIPPSTLITTDSNNSVITITFPPSVLVTTITPSGLHTHMPNDDDSDSDCELFRTCHQGDLLVIESATHQRAKNICQKYGMELASITSHNIENNAAALSKCFGPFQSAWIKSFNGDSYNGACLVLSESANDGVGAVTVPADCSEKKAVLCQRCDMNNNVHFQIEAEDNICPISLKGIHVINQLTAFQNASDICSANGWSLLDLGNFNLLSFLNVCNQCQALGGWVRSVHGYSGQRRIIYFPQPQPVLGVAMMIEDDVMKDSILAPVFCQENDPKPTTSSTYVAEMTITTQLSITPTIVVFESNITEFTVTSTVIVFEQTV